MERNDEKQDILAAYALGALNEVEAREVAAEIESDEDLRRELEAWKDVAANLAFAAPAAEPSPEARENLLAAIKKTPQKAENGEVAGEVLKTVEKTKNPPQELPEKADVIQFPTRAARFSFWSYAPVIGAVAASVVAVLLGVALYNASQSSRNKDLRLAELNQKLANAEQKLNDMQAQLERQWQERDLLNSPNSFDIKLIGADGSSSANARLVIDRQTGRTMLFVESLPPAPRGKVYQVWFINDPQHPTPGAVFSTNEAGRAVLRDNMPVGSLKASIFAITLEPEGGSPAPTSKPFLVGQSL